jgi:hypothetical protein
MISRICKESKAMHLAVWHKKMRFTIWFKRGVCSDSDFEIGISLEELAAKNQSSHCFLATINP